MTQLLVVEDDQVQRQMLGRLLSRYFRVTLCDQFAAADYDWSQYDIVLCDVLMAVHDGPSLVRSVAARRELMPLIVLYSALPTELLRREAEALSSVVPIYYLGKAGTPSIMVETLRALCEY